MPHCWPACGCRAELEHYYPEAPTPTPDVLNTLFFKHAVSLGRSGACHKSKNHHHYLEAIQLAREAAFAHQSTLQKKKNKKTLQAEFVLLDRHCKLRVRDWWWLPWTQFQIISFFPEAFGEKLATRFTWENKKIPSHVSDFLARRPSPFMFYEERVRHIASNGKFSSQQKASSRNRWQSEQSYVWEAHVPALGSWSVLTPNIFIASPESVSILWWWLYFIFYLFG